MEKSHIPYVIVGCIIFVFGVKSLSGMLFVMFEDWFKGKKEKNLDNPEDFEELINARKLMMKRSEPVILDEVRQKKKQDQKAGDFKALPEDTDPASLKRKAILHQIYDLKIARKKDESDSEYYSRVLKIPNAATSDMIKKAYKDRAKECHPDRFDLSSFDDKTKEKLKSKVHENFLVIQKAYDYFKKAA